MLIEHLRQEFKTRIRKNPRYSLRSFSRSLKIDSSTLSALLRNKRPLSAKMARKLLTELDIDDPVQRQRIFAASFEPSPNEGLVEDSTCELDLETFEVISTWEHFAVLALLEISLPRPDLKTLARVLKLPAPIVMSALSRLETLGLVANRFGRWSLTGRNLHINSHVPSSAIRKSNHQHIAKALASLESDPIEVRHISGVTMAIDTGQLAEARERIREFYLSLTSFLQKGTKKSVYRLNVQLFPLTDEVR